MTDNKRFKINAYIQLLRYIDDEVYRKVIVELTCDLLDMIPDTGTCRSEKGRPPVCLNDCVDVLYELFEENAKIPAADVLDILHRKGFSDSVIKRAKKEIGIESRLVGKFGECSWFWILEGGSK